MRKCKMQTMEQNEMKSNISFIRDDLMSNAGSVRIPGRSRVYIRTEENQIDRDLIRKMIDNNSELTNLINNSFLRLERSIMTLTSDVNTLKNAVEGLTIKTLQSQTLHRDTFDKLVSAVSNKTVDLCNVCTNSTKSMENTRIESNKKFTEEILKAIERASNKIGRNKDSDLKFHEFFAKIDDLLKYTNVNQLPNMDKINPATTNKLLYELESMQRSFEASIADKIKAELKVLEPSVQYDKEKIYKLNKSVDTTYDPFQTILQNSNLPVGESLTNRLAMYEKILERPYQSYLGPIQNSLGAYHPMQSVENVDFGSLNESNKIFGEESLYDQIEDASEIEETFNTVRDDSQYGLKHKYATENLQSDKREVFPKPDNLADSSPIPVRSPFTPFNKQPYVHHLKTSFETSEEGNKFDSKVDDEQQQKTTDKANEGYSSYNEVSFTQIITEKSSFEGHPAMLKNAPMSMNLKNVPSSLIQDNSRAYKSADLHQQYKEAEDNNLKDSNKYDFLYPKVEKNDLPQYPNANLVQMYRTYESPEGINRVAQESESALQNMVPDLNPPLVHKSTDLYTVARHQASNSQPPDRYGNDSTLNVNFFSESQDTHEEAQKPHPYMKAEGMYPNTDASRIYLGTEVDQLFTNTEANGIYPNTEADGMYSNTEADRAFPSTETDRVFSTSESDRVIPSSEADGMFPSSEGKRVFPSVEANNMFNRSEVERTFPKTEAERVFPSTEADQYINTETERPFLSDKNDHLYSGIEANQLYDETEQLGPSTETEPMYPSTETEQIYISTETEQVYSNNNKTYSEVDQLYSSTNNEPGYPNTEAYTRAKADPMYSSTEAEPTYPSTEAEHNYPNKDFKHIYGIKEHYNNAQQDSNRFPFENLAASNLTQHEKAKHQNSGQNFYQDNYSYSFLDNLDRSSQNNQSYNPYVNKIPDNNLQQEAYYKVPNFSCDPIESQVNQTIDPKTLYSPDIKNKNDFKQLSQLFDSAENELDSLFN